MESSETYSNYWVVHIVTNLESFYTNIWRDTAEGAEKAIKAMYPHAEQVTVFPA